MLPAVTYWTQIINFIIKLYLKETTICVIWNQNIDFNLNIRDFENDYAVINIVTKDLKNSFKNNVENFEKQEEDLIKSGLTFNDLTEKLTMSIAKSHCESFMAFQDDILPFIESFTNASQYSTWRSKRNRFVFGYLNQNFEENFEQHKFFEDQANILLVALDSLSSDIFNLKTNKFYGSKFEKQSSLILLDRFYASNETFLYNHPLFLDKFRNLHGREIIITGFDYRPYFIINYVKSANNSYDLAFDGSSEGSVQIDGTEARVILAFCEIYNCTLLIDSSEANDWGEVYANLTGDGSLGMVVRGTVEISIAAMYSWDVDYRHLDMSMYLVRTGVTCLVPAPRRLASWLLPLEPFQLTLWLAVLLYLVVEILSICCTHNLESWYLSEKLTWYSSFKFAYVFSLKLFVSQSGNEYIRSLTVRVLLFACFMNDIILTSIYGGGLASILTIPSYEEAADTVERMMSHNLKWTANSEAWTIAIRNTDDERMNTIASKFVAYTDEQLQMMAETRAYIGFSLERLPFGHFAIGDYLSSKGIENLKIMQEDLYFQYTVAFVQRCWPLLDQLDQLIYWWHSAGLDKYWEWRIVAMNLNVKKQKQVEASMYTNMEDMGPVKLGMPNFVGMLLIWVLGIVISILAFIYELIENYLKTKKK